MPPRGRKPKPTEVKRRQGNPGRRELNEREPKPTAAAPKRPDHLDADGKKCWRWLCGILRGMGLLATSDVAVMTIYCDAWSGYRRSRAGIVKYGSVMLSPKTSMPFLSAYTHAEAMYAKRLMTTAIELGLTPSARSRIEVLPQVGKSEGKGRFFKVVG